MKLIPYESRLIAGEILAEFTLNSGKSFTKELVQNPNNFFCFAIPNGGAPVVEGFCRMLNIKFDLLIVRKIKIPYNTEAGFGSVTPDGTVLLNESLLSRLNLIQKEIEKSIELTKTEIKERISFYDKKVNLDEKYKKSIHNKHIFIIDDGLASGFTMLAAVRMVKKYNPKKIFISVPTAPLHTVKRAEKEVDQIFCPNIRNTTWFAVADAYKHWYDVPESEVIEILRKSIYYFKLP